MAHITFLLDSAARYCCSNDELICCSCLILRYEILQVLYLQNGVLTPSVDSSEVLSEDLI